MSADKDSAGERRSIGTTVKSQQRLAIVTGGAGGLGGAFCRELVGRGGWHVVVVDVDETAGRQLVEELNRPATNGSAEFQRLDVSDKRRWAPLRDQLQQRWPRLELLINCAGLCGSGEIGVGSLDNFRRLLDVNLLGTLHACHTMAPWMKQAGGGHIVNVASIVGLIPGPAMSGYAASKAAVVALSEALYAELRPHGVDVTVVAPGFFRTPLLERGEFSEDAHRRAAQDYMDASTFSAEDVVKATLRGINRGELYVVVGRRARMYWRWKRLAPRSLARAISRRYRAITEWERRTSNNHCGAE